jgi:hypothetical protein
MPWMAVDARAVDGHREGSKYRKMGMAFFVN